MSSGNQNTLRYYLDPVITAKSMASSFNGSAVNIQFFQGVGVMLSWTGSNPVGTIGFQVSLDYDSRFPSNAIWANYQAVLGTNLTIVPAGTAAIQFVNFQELNAMWFRVIYTTAGGSSGLLTAEVGAKGF